MGRLLMNKNPSAPPLFSRRDVLRKSVLFSTGLLAGKAASQAGAVDLDTSFTGPGLNLLAIGDYGSKNESQERVARQMANFAKKLGQPLDGVLALGDNFYGKMTPDRFDRHFEKMYDPEALNCPFYACIGNHDYETAAYGLDPEPRKFVKQLDYARDNPNSRWKMPAKWYVLELPNPVTPLVKMIVLDSNMAGGTLTPQEKLEQKRFVEAELAKPTTAPWLWMVWHHPLYTETSKREDNPGLVRMFGDFLKNHPVSVCITGHDHNMQHLKVEGYSTSFIVSGAGGAAGYPITPSDRGFSKMELGFNHFHISPTRIKAQFINAEGECLHTFRRTLDGKVEIVT